MSPGTHLTARADELLRRVLRRPASRNPYLLLMSTGFDHARVDIELPHEQTLQADQRRLHLRITLRARKVLDDLMFHRYNLVDRPHNWLRKVKRARTKLVPYNPAYIYTYGLTVDCDPSSPTLLQLPNLKHRSMTSSCTTKGF